jgi:imidazolonepropionase-like amidohydrolase
MQMISTTDTTLLVHGKGIYDSEKHSIRSDNGLLISGEKIKKIGIFETLQKEYPDAKQVDLSSSYLFPGLFNTHVHLEFDASLDPLPVYLGANERVRFMGAAVRANALLRSGVTTVRDAGSTWDLLNLQDALAHETIQLPRLQLAGPPLTVTGGHMHFMGGEVDTIDELIRSVRLHQKRGCGAIKLVVTGGQLTPGSGADRTSYSIEQIQAVTKEAAHLGLPTFAHCLTTKGFVNAVEGGVECIEHVACFIRNKENQILERVYEPKVMEQYRGVHKHFTQAISCFYHVLDPYRSGEKECTPRDAFLVQQEINQINCFRNCVELGLIPVCGTDAGMVKTWFDETFLELEVFVERCGLTTSQVIDIATINSADALGLGNVTGRLVEGYSADIIALKKNPLDDIHSFRNVEQVICKGVCVNAK